jgi:hypothetical protein
MSILTNIKSSTPISIPISSAISKSQFTSKINQITNDYNTEYINNNIQKFKNIIPEIIIDTPNRSPAIAIPKSNNAATKYYQDFQLSSIPNFPAGKTPPDNDWVYRIYLNYISKKNISSF